MKVSRFQGFHCPVPLGEDGLSGTGPLPWALEAVLVWSTGSKENFPGQPGVSEQKGQDLGLGTDKHGQLVQILDVVELVLCGIFNHTPEKGNGVCLLPSSSLSCCSTPTPLPGKDVE